MLIRNVRYDKIYSDFYINQVMEFSESFKVSHAKAADCFWNNANGSTDHIVKDCALFKDIRIRYLGLSYFTGCIKDLLMDRRSTLAIWAIVSAYFEMAFS